MRSPEELEGAEPAVDAELAVDAEALAEDPRAAADAVADALAGEQEESPELELPEDADENADDDAELAPYAGPALDLARPDVPARPAPLGLALDDPALAAPIELARAAILEVTEASDLGDPVGVVDERDGVYSIQFAATRKGYPDWRWTATLVDLEGQDGPTVLETEMLPSEESLLAPAWIPWAERLAEFQAAHRAAEEAEAEEQRTVRRVERQRRRRRIRADEEPEAQSGPEAAEAAAAQADAAAAAARAELAEEGAERARVREVRRTEQRARRRRRIVAPELVPADDLAAAEALETGELDPDALDEPGTVDDLVPAVDIREFADEMDERLDGVSFEDDADETDDDETPRMERS